MNLFRTASLKNKQVMIVMAITSVAVLLASIGFTFYEVMTFRSATEGNLSIQAEIIGHNISEDLVLNDHDAVEATISALRADPDILGACVYAGNGRVFATYQRTNSGADFTLPPLAPTPAQALRNGLLVLSRPVVSHGHAKGTVYLVSDLSELLFWRLGRYVGMVAAVLALTLIIAWMLSSRLQRFISDPILCLAHAVSAVNQNQDYSVRVEQHNPDEIGGLIIGFNRILGQVQQCDLELQKTREALETRVRERTTELAAANAALQQENLERKQAEASVRRTEDLYRRAIRGAGAVPYAYDFPTKSYLFMDEGIQQLIGYSAQEVRPALWAQLMQESVMGGETSGMDKAEVARKIIHGGIRSSLCDLRVRTRDGALRWISDGSVHSFDESGNFLGSIGILQDVTERKQAESSAVAFSKLGQALFSATTLEAASRIISNVAETLFSLDAFALHLYVSETDEIYPVYQCDAVDGQRVDFTMSKERQKPSPTSRRVLEKGAELISKDGMDPNSVPYGNTSRPSASIMRVPLRVGAKAIGVVAVHSYTPHAHSPKDLNILQTLADYCGGAFERIWAEESLKGLHKQLLETSRQAGMAEVATSVLHNVGNVLNSINVSASVAEDVVGNSRLPDLLRLARLLQEHAADEAAFLTSDPRGQKVPEIIRQLAERLDSEQAAVREELGSLRRNVDHIKNIVAMQQSYARASGVLENIQVAELVEDALRMNAGALERHAVKVVRDYAALPPICTDKHKLLQIIINLVRNAKYACDDSGRDEKQIMLRTTSQDGWVRIAVIDNGVGIPAENLTRIFSHGFTTRKDGHGFGLHSGVLAARDLGGSLTVHSEGPGRGAAFTLELPCQRPPETAINPTPNA
jgi:PAS domain S-box-containing protein